MTFELIEKLYDEFISRTDLPDIGMENLLASPEPSADEHRWLVACAEAYRYARRYDRPISLEAVLRLTGTMPREFWYVCAYEVGQAYGGPEEGGWWYTVGELKEQKGPFLSHTDAYKAREKLVADSEPFGKYRMGYGSHDGVNDAGEGDDSCLLPGGTWGNTEIQVSISKRPGASFPATRPHYE